MTDTPPAAQKPAFELIDDFPGPGLNNLVPYTDILEALTAAPLKTVAIRGRTDKDANKIKHTFQTHFPQVLVRTKMGERAGGRDVFVRFKTEAEVLSEDAKPPSVAAK